jgi:hypothetical protein
VRLRAWSLAIATALIGLLGVLVASSHQQGAPPQEPPSIVMVLDTGVLPPPPKPVPPPILDPAPPVAAPELPAARPDARRSNSANPPEQPSLNRATEQRPVLQLDDRSATAPGPTPQIATAPVAGNGSATSRDTAGSTRPSVSAATSRTLRALECERLAVEDRPPDCPPQGARLMAAAEEANRPRPDPERAPGRSRAERNALFKTGLRDPCQTESGARAQVCIPLGPAPSRVRSAQEICRAQGLSNCVDLPPELPQQ